MVDIDKSKEVKECYEFLKQKFGIDDELELPRIYTDLEDYKKIFPAESYRILSFQRNELGFYDRFTNALYLGDDSVITIGEEVGHWLHVIVNPLGTLRIYFPDELKRYRKQKERREKSKIAECVGHYAAIIYSEHIGQLEETYSWYEEFRRNIPLSKRIRMAIQRIHRYNIFTIHPWRILHDALDIIDDEHIDGYALAYRLFDKHGDSRLAEASRAMTWKELQRLL